MCKSKAPKVTTTVQRPVAPPEPPATLELGSRRRRQERGSRSRRLGTSALRIDVNVPGATSGGGINTGT